MSRRAIIVNHDTQEGLRQKAFIQKQRERNAAFEKVNGRKKKMHITTFGCQMNTHDSEKLKGVLEEMGYEETDQEHEADFIVYNTCAVRENAETRVFGRIGALKSMKKNNPELIIALCGCMMQQDHIIDTLKKSYRHVDLVFGTHNIYKLAELIDSRMESKRPIYDIWDSYQDIVEDLPTIREHRHKASVNIIFGCNNFCSYCIVPYVRGRERSRALDDILEEVRLLAEDGALEITFLGQNVNSYGKDLNPPVPFSKLLEEAEKIEGIKRIRFMTSHPKDLSQDLIDVIASSKKICHSLHLPFQSGSTEILSKMNRRYTKESYLDLIRRIKEKIPNVALTTDIIVAFPGESEEDFEETLDIVRQVGYDQAFTFIYSKRTGTPAALYEEQVPEEIAKNRFNRLLELVNESAYQKSIAHIGRRVEVLFEEESKHQKGILTGRLENGHIVHVPGEIDLIGTLGMVQIIDAKSFYLVGEIVHDV